MMIEKLGDTITAAKDPSKDITSLPVLNKYLLHEVARALKNKNPEYNMLFTNTQELSKKYAQYQLDVSMKRINYAYQLGTDYSKYLDLDHNIYEIPNHDGEADQVCQKILDIVEHWDNLD